MESLADDLTEASMDVGNDKLPAAADQLRTAAERWAAAALKNLKGKQRTAALRIASAVSDFLATVED